jgi:DNA-binding MarR family transcriptional regulator
MSETIENRLLALLRHLGSLPVLHIPNDVELSPPGVAQLTWVSRSPGCGVLDIAKGLRLSPPTVSVGIRRLVEAGWLEQRTDPNDLRARPIFLTKKGEELVNRMREHRAKMLRFFLSGLTEDEQEQLLELLERAIKGMERKISEGISIDRYS